MITDLVIEKRINLAYQIQSKEVTVVSMFCMILQINAFDKKASNKQDAAIANPYGNKFFIPLNFTVLDSTIPYCQLGLRNRLCYKITFNDYGRVILSPGSPAKIVSSGSPAKPDTKYKIVDVSLEFEIVTEPDLARCIMMEYQSMAFLYDRVLRDRPVPVNKSDTTWSWSFNSTCRCLKSILVLLKVEQSYT